MTRPGIIIDYHHGVGFPALCGHKPRVIRGESLPDLIDFVDEEAPVRGREVFDAGFNSEHPQPNRPAASIVQSNNWSVDLKCRVRTTAISTKLPHERASPCTGHNLALPRLAGAT